jgi:pilus assembly protein FimV
MVGSSKILTVSYGTFSCTLEGFDDPFSTMKSIAEYFRDLAADDRYFGAEPPTPDAEMLHRIAEREVQRRVEARLSSGGIVLRQLEEAEDDAPPPHAVAPAEPARKPERAPAAPAGDSVASKLSRIRAVVDRARATSMPARPVAPPASALPETYEEDEDTRAETPEAPVARPAVDEEPEEAREIAARSEDQSLGDDADDQDDGEPPRPWESAVDTVEEAELAAIGGAEDGEKPGLVADGRDEDDFEEEDEEPQDDLTRRIVHLSHSGSRNGFLTDEDEDNRPVDDPTLAGIRMALDVEKEALAQERKEARMERRHVLIGGDPDREPAFDRILEETNTKMADREGTRRRSAIAHLKAAVAATKADRMLKRERSREVDEEEQRDYREDLAKVVRPRRSEPRESAAEKVRPRLIDETAAPLILGSSQRIDTPDTPGETLEKTDLRPRRVGAGMLALDEEAVTEDHEEDDSEFIAFAESVGATNLPDLLEAAAAYTAFVEQQPSFSRPQIMRRAAAIETDEEFTREAGLRSFGQLLRQGKIRKLQRGQFTISESTRFHPEARIAGE